MKKAISFLTSLALLLSVLSINVYASGFKDITLSAEDMQTDAYQTVEDALRLARDNASDSLVYRIYVPAGEYTLTSGLHIYSNTQLYLDSGTTLYRGFESGNMIKAGLKGEITQKYSGYKNIVVDGGTWDSQYVGGSCAMRFAHCTNLTVSNLTVRDIKNAHHIEVAAVDGFNLTGCSFMGMNKTDDSSAEAVQIDILHEYEHFPDYEDYDDTPCRNVNITGCIFSDLYAGVGTRSGVVGSYFENINISGNTFRNISERAISCFNYRNSTISNNLIDNVTQGIVFEHLPSSNIAARLFLPNDGAPGNIVQNSSSKIYSNTINVNRLTDNDCFAIFVYGGALDAASAKAYDVVSGKYFVKNIDIYSNTIACRHSLARGIFLTGVLDCDVTSNSISSFAASADGINAINLCASSRNAVRGNYIYGFNNGVSLYGNDDGNSRGNSIDADSINSARSYGVRVASGSTATVKNNNVFSSCGVSNICIASKNYAQDLPAVTVKSIGRSSSGRALIRWYALDGADGYKIYRAYTPDGQYRQIASVKGGGTLVFTDKSSRPGFTYYYKIYPYRSASSCAVVSPSAAFTYVTL